VHPFVAWLEEAAVIVVAGEQLGSATTLEVGHG
jgi:hypothetical protein